jgi:hypothetical protein
MNNSRLLCRICLRVHGDALALAGIGTIKSFVLHMKRLHGVQISSEQVREVLQKRSAKAFMERRAVAG